MKKLLVIVAIAAIFAIASADMKSDSLAAHNDERNAHGVPSLTWSSTLAQSAQAYAEVMASTGTTSHSKGRVNVGENLAWGSGKNVDTSFLAGLWVDEKEYYIPGRDFPDCSNTGSWHDVAHYTQLMWEQTTEFGCGIAQSSSGRYNYVCQYSPQGNMDGEPIYTVGASPISSSTSDPVTSDPVASDPVTSDPVTSDPVTSDPVTSDPITVDPVTSDPATSDPVVSDPVATPDTTTTSSASTGPSTSQPYSYSTSAPDASSSAFQSDCLYAHNYERNNYGVPSLTWSTSLAQTAQSYAQHMASTGSTSHSTGRVNVGENLAWQSGSGTTTQALANRWLAEKQYYIAGRNFPNCSTTGNWLKVAHYTQMMWRKTTQVGCGVSKSRSGMYYYVCHYSVQGNMNGQSVY